MKRCIYCLTDERRVSFIKSEHVMPKSFGVFDYNNTGNFTLHNGEVCDKCNQYFGDNLEMYLARDTFEDLIRHETGIRKTEEYTSKGKSRIQIKVEEGKFQGAYGYLDYCEKVNKHELKPYEQIGFKKSDSDEYVFFLKNEIPDRNYLESNGFDLKGSKSVIILMNKEIALKILKDKGIDIRMTKEIVQEEKDDIIECELIGRIDNTIMRAIAKIAFNYLAYWEKADFVLNSSFDDIRNYIRYGSKCEYPLVVVSNEPILQDEKQPSLTGSSIMFDGHIWYVEEHKNELHSGKILENPKIKKNNSPSYYKIGHIITVNWTLGKISLMAQVSLFNLVTYKIFLARYYKGIIHNVSRGHFFNIGIEKEHRKILDMIHY